MAELQIRRRLDDVEGIVARAKAECVKWNSIWDGDEERGRYVLRSPLGSVEGSYTVEGRVVTFLVERKSRLIPNVVLERVLDEFLGPSAHRI